MSYFTSAKLLRLCSTLLISVTLFACTSFHLRGTQNVDVTKQQLTLTYKTARINQIFDQKLRKRLDQAGIETVALGNYQLNVESIESTRESVTFESDSTVDEYALRLRVAFRITRNSDKSTDRFVVISERTYSYDADNQTAKEEQESTLRSELYDNLIERVMTTYMRFSPEQ